MLRLREPRIVDRWGTVVPLVLWAIYTVWGFLYGTASETSLVAQTTSSPLYAFLWSYLIGIVAFIACVSTLVEFFSGRNVRRLVAVQIETYCMAALLCLVVVYPVFQIIHGVSKHDLTAVSSGVLDLSFLVFPGWRIHDLNDAAEALKDHAQRRALIAEWSREKYRDSAAMDNLRTATGPLEQIPLRRSEIEAQEAQDREDSGLPGPRHARGGAE